MPSPSATSSFSKRARSYSRPQTPTQRSSSSIYNPSPSRAKPKVLPFPDLSVRAVSRDASQTTSPTDTPPLTVSPRESRSGSTIGLASLRMEVTASGSGYFGSRTDLVSTPRETVTLESEEGARRSLNAGSSTSASAINSASGTGADTPSGSGSGTTTPRSPLGHPSFSIANLPIPTHPNRVRSFTTPDDMQPRSRTSTSAAARPAATYLSPSASGTSSSSSPHPLPSPSPTPPSILLNPNIVPAASTTRVEGFNPVPLSPTTTIRPSVRPSSSVPTTIHIAQPPHAPAQSSTSARLSTSAGASANVTATASATALPSTPLPQEQSSLPSTSSQPTKRLYTAITPIKKMDHGLSEHLYKSFQDGSCADVRVWVRKWGVGWPLHKMVLIQTGFFHSMFMGGFSETGGKSAGKGKGRMVWENNDRWTGEDFELQFDDPNITRAAFEICLSRLYSPYPHLIFPDSLIPTPIHPLTPAFTTSEDPFELEDRFRGDGHCFDTSPRLLLSLLATTTYLGQDELMKEVLTMILRTVCPFTLCRYLNFAIGEGLGEEEWRGQTKEPAPGIKHAARRLRIEEEGEAASGPSSSRSRSARSSTDSTGSNTKVQDDEQILRNPGGSRRTSRPSPLSFDNSPPSAGRLEDSAEDEEIEAYMPHFYGFASDKIGEACCCFLTRWGLEILDRESRFPNPAETGEEPPWRVFASGGLHAKFVRALLSSDQLFVKDEMSRYKAARKILDLRRRESQEDGAGDLGLSVARIELDSEMTEEEEDEIELEKVFTDGIYYTHMTFEDLSTIAADIDPLTALPFAPLNVLQAAHWSAADLKSRVLVAGAEDNLEPDLGLTKPTSALIAPPSRRRRGRSSRTDSSSNQSMLRSTSSTDPSSSISSLFANPQTAPGTMFHPVPPDDTHRIGAAGLLYTSASVTAEAPLPGIPGIPDLGPASVASPSFLDQMEPQITNDDSRVITKVRPQPHSEKTYFGLSRQCRLLSDLVSSPPQPSQVETKWSNVEPFRFSVEFWDVQNLIERERTYSTTHFFGGNWFNVYVQTIRRKEKGLQLGVYLHRQSPGEPFPVPSSPGGQATAATAASVSGVGGLTGGAPLDRTTTAHATVGSPRAGEGASPYEDLDEEVKKKEAYRDNRPITKAYFSISCASALGTALIRFSSAPDNFSLSQSWGWKSSALRSAEYLSGDVDMGRYPPEHGDSAQVQGQEATQGMLEQGVLGWVADSTEIPKGGSLRASVVVGLI